MNRYTPDRDGVMREDPDGEWAKCSPLFAPTQRDELLQAALKTSEAANAALWRLRAAAEAVLKDYADTSEQLEPEQVLLNPEGAPYLERFLKLRAALDEIPYQSLAKVQREAVMAAVCATETNTEEQDFALEGLLQRADELFPVGVSDDT